MKRRNFIKLSATASVIGLTPFELQAALKSFMPFDNCPNISNRKLVLINLAGANDGLNTIIPINEYDNYANLRPDIKVPEQGNNRYITLDKSLPSNQQIGLNPVLTGFKSMYDAGTLRIIQSVGYPSQNKSHFKSTDLYLTGNDGNSTLNGGETGWIGRFMELYYADLLLETFPLAVEIGSEKTSLGFHGEQAHGMSLNITGQDPAGFYNILNGLGGAPITNIPNSDYGKQLEFINNTDALSNTYAQSISTAFNKGKNETSYPDTDLSNQLKTVAKLISGDLKSKVYMVRISGFDTHKSQVQDSGGVIGKHADLLNELSTAINAFLNDLTKQNLAKDVVGLTFSEFGRKVAQNGNLGTDHGEIAPMFVFGAPVAGGVSGTNPDLTEATDRNNFQIKTVQYDYRQTFGTLLQDFIGADQSIIDAAFFNHTSNSSFADAKIPELLRKPLSQTCQNAVLTSFNTPESKAWTLSPNPFKDFINFTSSENNNTTVSYNIYNAAGLLILSNTMPLSNGFASINLQFLKRGFYIFEMKVGNKKEIHKVVKI